MLTLTQPGDGCRNTVADGTSGSITFLLAIVFLYTTLLPCARRAASLMVCTQSFGDATFLPMRISHLSSRPCHYRTTASSRPYCDTRHSSPRVLWQDDTAIVDRPHHVASPSTLKLPVPSVDWYFEATHK